MTQDLARYILIPPNNAKTRWQPSVRPKRSQKPKASLELEIELGRIDLSALRTERAAEITFAPGAARPKTLQGNVGSLRACHVSSHVTEQ